MSLSIFYRDELNEEKQLDIRVVLNADFSYEVEIFDHPSETKIDISDSIIETASEIPVTVWVPGEEQITQLVQTPPELTKSGVYTVGIVQEVNIKRTKYEVLNLLQNLQKSGTIIDYLNINGNIFSADTTSFSGYTIKSMSYTENIDIGDGWDLNIVFKPCRIVFAEKTKASADIINRLRNASAINNANKTKKQEELGEQITLKSVAYKLGRKNQYDNRTLSDDEWDRIKEEYKIQKTEEFIKLRKPKNADSVRQSSQLGSGE